MRTPHISALVAGISLLFGNGLSAFGAAAPPAAGGAGAAPAAPDQIKTERPGFTNSAEIVAPGRTQLESGLTVARTPAALGGTSATDYPQALLRRGLTPRLELRLGLPDYTYSPSIGQGFGDASLGIKYQVYQSRDGSTKFAITPSLTIPVGNAAFTSGHVDPLLILAGQTASGARWGIQANISLSDPTQFDGRNFTAAPSVTVSYQLTPRLSSYGELYDSFPRRGGPSPITDGGFAYLLGPNIQVDAEAGLGLGGVAPVRYFGGGLAVRF